MHDFIWAVGMFVVVVIGSAVILTLGFLVIDAWIHWYYWLRRIRRERGQAGSTGV